jgi:hypothetical protein
MHFSLMPDHVRVVIDGAILKRLLFNFRLRDITSVAESASTEEFEGDIS